MQADFCLGDPVTFQQVVPLQELGGFGRRSKKTAKRNAASGNKSPPSTASTPPPTSSKLLHEKVEEYEVFNSHLLFCSHLSLSCFSSPPPSPSHQLSHYLDVIEVHLAYQISQRSDLFFSTLSSQQELQSHIMSVLQNAVELRSLQLYLSYILFKKSCTVFVCGRLCLRDLDRRLTHKHLELMRFCTQRHRNSQVLLKLRVSSTPCQHQGQWHTLSLSRQ